jgi:glutathione S-transferase
MARYVLHEWRISPFCNKARKILRFKGQPFEVVRYNGITARRAGKLTPVGKLPALELDGTLVQDSAAIARALEERHPEPRLYPADPVARAEAGIWESWAGDALYWFEVYYRFAEPDARGKAIAALSEDRPAWERLALTLALRRMYKQKLHAQGIGRLAPEEVDRRLQEHLDQLEAILATRPWLVGDRCTIADLSVAPQLEEMVRTSRPREWILARPAVVRWLEQLEPELRTLT